MVKHPQRFWLVALIVAWAVDFLFWGKPLGISLLLFVLLALAGSYLLAHSEQIRPARYSILMGGLVIILASATVVRSEPFTRMLNGLLAAGGLLLMVMTFRGGGWVRYKVFDYLIAALELFFVSFFRAAGLPLLPKDEQGATRWYALRRFLPVFRGLLLALPVVLVLGALLSSADLVFADRLKGFFAAFDLARAPEYLFRLFYILFLAYVFAGYYLQALHPSRWGSSAAAAVDKAPASALAGGEPAGAAELTPAVAPVLAPSIKRLLGSIEAFVILGSVNLLYALFVAIQFRYFFGGQSNISETGYTYSEYARRGFFELIWVAVISLMLFLVLSAVTRRETLTRGRIFSGLSILLVAQVLVMLVSAFQRLLLYEDAYGFTNLRTYTHIFIPWLGLLLLATIGLEIVKHEEYFGALVVLCGFGFAITMSAVNIDGFIVRQNLARARAGLELDGVYLATLSDDALPMLASEYRRGDSSAQVEDTLGAILACRAEAIRKEQKQPWQAYHFGQAAARRALPGLDLSKYSVRHDVDGDFVRLTSGKFSCNPPRGMD